MKEDAAGLEWVSNLLEVKVWARYTYAAMDYAKPVGIGIESQSRTSLGIIVLTLATAFADVDSRCFVNCRVA